jgi:hypothetical protein
MQLNFLKRHEKPPPKYAFLMFIMRNETLIINGYCRAMSMD